MSEKIYLRATVRFLLNGYDIPMFRRDVSNDDNLQWIDRNLLINNPKEEITLLILDYINRILSGEEWICLEKG